MGIDSYQYREKKAASAGAPIVFTFHRTGGDEDQFLPLAGRILPEAGVVSPRGDVSEHGALRFFRRKAEGVYDFEDLTVRSHAMAGFVRAHKEQAKPSAASASAIPTAPTFWPRLSFKTRISSMTSS
jgi:phospholipase/carboxylesterase